MAFYEPGQSTPPEGWTQDANDPEGRWWHNPDPAIDINNMENWWQAPPAGFQPDPNSPGWWFDPTKNIAADPTAWWHDLTVIDDPATKALSYWTSEEIAAVAQVPVSSVTDNWPFICRAAGLWKIDEPLVMMGMLGTTMKETGSLYPVREAWWVWDKDQQAAINYYLYGNHAAYEGGWQFHGRGYVQATHRSLYQLIQNEIKQFGIEIDLVGHPDLLLVPEYAAHGMCIFFLNKPGLIAACQNRNWAEVRRLVWGANGDVDGIGKLQRVDASLTPLAIARGVLS
jgi:predicted chitinase